MFRKARRIRMERGITLIEACEQAQIGFDALSAFENGGRMLSGDRLLRLGDLLDTDPRVLAAEDTEAQPAIPKV